MCRTINWNAKYIIANMTNRPLEQDMYVHEHIVVAV